MFVKILGNLETSALRFSVMHEMGIAMQLVEIAIDAIPDDMKGAPVERVYVKIGKFTAVIPSSLKFCFDIVSQGTPLADAELDIEEIPVTAKCKECHHKWEISVPVFRCESCDSGAIEVISGRELNIESIEIKEIA